MKHPRIMLADDHTLVVEAFRKLLESTYDVVGTVRDGHALLAAAPALKPDVVVIDIGMPRLNGLEAGRQLKQTMPEIKLIFMTMNTDPDLAVDAMRQGASGYVLKTSATSELFHAIQAALRAVRQQVRRELLAEGKKHPAWKRLCQIPSIGPIRSAVLLGILQTPHRFRTKRQLWTYSGFGIETQSSADHRSINGQLERAKKQISIRGLNRNYNHDLKNLFKGAAIVASSKPGPFQEFYTALLAKGIRPEMARLTLARKIATIVLIVWKRGACFDAQHLKPQTA